MGLLFCANSLENGRHFEFSRALRRLENCHLKRVFCQVEKSFVIQYELFFQDENQNDKRVIASSLSF